LFYGIGVGLLCLHLSHEQRFSVVARNSWVM